MIWTLFLIVVNVPHGCAETRPGVVDTGGFGLVTPVGGGADTVDIGGGGLLIGSGLEIGF